MRRLLETEDITIKGLEDFCKEARANGAVGEDVPKLIPKYDGSTSSHPMASSRVRPAKITVELPTPLRRVIRARAKS